ncbi:hypothetical protein B7463_g829, partial [Scytalidium lignicola]
MEAHFGVEKLGIPKLSQLNYWSWSVQVKELLIAHCLWDVVSLGVLGTEGTTPESSTRASSTESDQTMPQGSGQEPTNHRDRATDRKASNIILGLCNQTLKGNILGLKTAKERWETLKDMCAQLGRKQLLVKLEAFQAYQLPKNNASVATIATELSTLQAGIGGIDFAERPSDNAKIAVFFRLLQELDSRFDPLILQFQISNLPVNFSLMVSMFSDMERHMESKESLKKGASENQFNGKCFNCGASRYIPYSKEAFKGYSKRSEPIDIQTAAGAEILATGQGAVPLKIALKDSLQPVALTEVLHVPDFTGSLISVL